MNSGDTAWLLTSAALVLFMTVGLAFFYGGLEPRRNVLHMLMMNFFSIAIVTVVWSLLGFTLAFGPDVGGGFIGNLHYAALMHMGGVWPGTHIPKLVFMAFQLMFAIITPALVSGALAGRLKFQAWVAFCVGWSLVVYPVIAHWLFDAQGWLYVLGARDFAGGAVVHASAGVSALVMVLLVGPRAKSVAESYKPHSVPLVLLGAGILWFGWFGFNAGSALGANQLAANAFTATQLAAASASIALGPHGACLHGEDHRRRAGDRWRSRPGHCHAGIWVHRTDACSRDRVGRGRDLLPGHEGRGKSPPLR